MKISIVIPVYNEARYLTACLDSIAAQTELPDEVIIVDNNSADESLAIARSYSFVRVIKESRQGIIYANLAGFKAARYEIIGRIDADSRLDRNWVAVTKSYFSQHEDVAAVTGKCYFFDFPWPKLVSAIHAFYYEYLQYVVAGNWTLWATNMAIRQSVWQSVRHDLHRTAWTNEDMDMTLVLRKYGWSIRRLLSLRVEASMLRGNLRPLHVLAYLQHWPANYWRNRLWFRGLLFQLVVIINFLMLLPFLVAHTVAMSIAESKSRATVSVIDRV